MLRIVRVPVDADLKTIYMSEMDNVLRAAPSAKIVLSVPDQSSHTAELNMVKHFGGIGFNRIEVMTFHQIARRFLKKDAERYLDAPGRMMLLYKAMCSAGLENSIFASSLKRSGFLESASSMICELKRYCIAPEQVRKAAEEQDNAMLSKKLEALYLAYDKYNSLFDEFGYFDSENDLFEAAGAIPNSDYFRGAYVWFAGFADFLPQHYEVIGAMLDAGANINVYVTAGTEEISAEESIFSVPEKTVDRLIRLCREHNAAFDITRDMRSLEKSDELKFLAAHYPYADAAFEGDCRNINITEFAGRYDEVEYAAELIADLVLDEGFRYSDICVACTDYQAYAELAAALFSEYKIPYFSDYKTPASEHTISALLGAVFDMASDNRSYESVFRFLRTGLVCAGRLSRDDIDEIENHVLSRGIRGSMWDNADFWLDSDSHVFDEALGEYKTKYTDGEQSAERRTVPAWEKSRCFSEPLAEFCKSAQKKASARQIGECLFDFFDKIGLYGSVNAMVEKCRQAEPDIAAQYTRVWNLIVELCGQAAVVMGSEKHSFEEFGEFIKIGLSACELSIIPQGIDRVTVTDTERVTDDNIKVMIVLGANHGAMPSVKASEGLLSDSERSVLEERGIELAPGNAGRVLAEEFRLYKTLCIPVQRLYICYPLSDCDGNALLAADAAGTVKSLFPGLSVGNGSIGADSRLRLSTPEVTIHKLIRLMSKRAELPKLWQYAALWYAQRGDEWTQRLDTAELMSGFCERTPELSADGAERLYGDYNKYSVSRLEEYFICPFRYFLKNGLRLEEREVRKIGRNDIGDILHYAIERYCMTVDSDAEDAAEKKRRWDALDEAQSLRIVDGIVSDIMQTAVKMPYGAKKMKYVINRVGDVMRRCVPVINYSFKNSKYTSAGYEWKFEDLRFEDGERTVSLHGVIDRVDIYEDEERGRAYIRVLDYKTGAKRFSETEIYNRLDFQLVVYAVAAAQMYKSGGGRLEPEITGLFYNKVHNRYEKAHSAEAERSEDVLDGMIYCDTDENGVYDMKMLTDFDYEIGKAGRGRYVNVKMKANGADLYKSSSVSESGRIKLLEQWAEHCIIEADRNIRSGNIAMMPYKKGSKDTGCTHYCPYTDICGFDRERHEKYRELEGSKADCAALIRERLGVSSDG